jgi:hypothetical protein
VSLDCQFLIAPTVFFVMEFCFVCPRLMSFVSHVATVSRLSILDCPYSFLVMEFCFVCPRLLEQKTSDEDKQNKIPQQRKL